MQTRVARQSSRAAHARNVTASYQQGAAAVVSPPPSSRRRRRPARRAAAGRPQGGLRWKLAKVQRSYGGCSSSMAWSSSSMAMWLLSAEYPPSGGGGVEPEPAEPLMAASCALPSTPW